MDSPSSPYRSQQLHSRTESPVSPLVTPLVANFPTVPRSSNAQQQRHLVWSDPFDMNAARASPNMSRTGSISSGSNTSNRANQLVSTPANVYPPPAYVAHFGAEQVVSERKRRFSDDEDDDDAGPVSSLRDDMHFSAQALLLLNGFLDQMLYSVLGSARSTTLTALRPAVTEVLKARLAAEAIASAEEELQELLAGGEEEEDEMNHRQTVAEQNRTWDTELVWKRTRLRVMVYIRLGEMEDDDEERYVREDELFHGSDRRFSHSSGLVSWAAAIFLTSVLEYVAEQVLQAAARAADARTRRQSRNPRVAMSPSGMVTPVDGVTVEDYDMEKVALNSTLGRLWRTWRKSLRSTVNGAPPTPSTTASNNFSRRFSKDAFGAGLSPRRSSFGAGPGSVSAMDDSRRPSLSIIERDPLDDAGDDLSETQYPEHVLAANIPLPMTDEKRDVDEIEVPGLAQDPDHDEADANETPVESISARRNTFTASTPFQFMAAIIGKLIPSSAVEDPEETPAPARPIMTRQRSMSVPTIFWNRPSEQEQKMAEDAQGQDEEEKEESELKPDQEPKPEQEQEHELKQEPEQGQGQDNEHEQGVSMIAEDAESRPAEEEEKANKHETAVPEPETSTVVSPPNEAVVKTSEVESSSDKGVFERAVAIASAGTATVTAAAVSMATGSRSSKDTGRSMPGAYNEVEERDTQKNLVGLKRLSVPSASNLKRVYLQHDEAQRDKRRSWSQSRFPVAPASESQDSFTLADVGDRSLEDERDEPIGHIGVARTSDTAVSTVRGGGEEAIPVEWRYARDSYSSPTPRRQSRLILGAEPEAPPSPERKVSPPAVMSEDVTTPQSFLAKRSLSITAKPAPIEKAKGPLPVPQDQARLLPPKSSKRASIPSPLVLANGNGNTAATASLPEKTPSPWRQSFTAATGSPSWIAGPKKSASISESPGPVHEHPVVQKMANMKNIEISKPRDEDMQPLTSASIKGPEDFEMFVQGGDTVKYTLTPENVRDGSVKLLPPVSQSGEPEQWQSSTAVTARKQVPPPPPDGRVGRSQSVKLATSASTGALGESEDASRSRASTIRDNRRSISRPPVRNTSVHRRSGLIAREPQVQTESTLDFADFIRSTGPDKEPEIRPLRSHRSTASLTSFRSTYMPGSRSSSPGGASQRSLNRFSLQNKPVPPVPPMPGKGKSILQPRGPTSGTGMGTSDLIDFIRSGPGTSDNSEQGREHRIPRTVAPFRTTMDSDQLNDWGDRLSSQPDLKLNTYAQPATSLKSTSSVRSSHRTRANSRSALLSSTNDPTPNPQPQRLSGKPMSPPPGPPSRTQHRGKDPYCLDFLEDEDDDFLTALPKSRREEESLLDFLNNTEPPTDNGLRPNKKPTTPVANMAAHRQNTASLSLLSTPSSKLEARSRILQSTDNATDDLADFLRTSGPTEEALQPRPTMSLRQTSKASTASSSKSWRSGRFSGFFSGMIFGSRKAGKTTTAS